MFLLYSALAAHRNGEAGKARTRLLDAMLGNLHLLPHLFDAQFDATGIWFCSDCASEDHLQEVDEFLHEPSAQERQWMQTEWNSPGFTRLRDGYVRVYSALSHERDAGQRGRLLDQWNALYAAGLID